MIFPKPLVTGRLIKRYKRFLSDIELDNGEIVTAHCANPGSMLGLAEPGSRVWLSRSTNPKRKLPFSWELVDDGRSLVGINTSRPNDLVAEAVTSGAVAELAGYQDLKREVPYGQNSRIDLLLESPDRPSCYVEIKSVTLSRRPGVAEFPDSVTARGAKHLDELAAVAQSGARAVLFFLAQRTDCDRLEVAADLDPAYAEAFARASASGVEVVCYGCKVGPEAIELDRPLPVAQPEAR